MRLVVTEGGMCDQLGHLPVVTVKRPWRRLFRPEYHIRCWECNFTAGPFGTREEAEELRRGVAG